MVKPDMFWTSSLNADIDDSESYINHVLDKEQKINKNQTKYHNKQLSVNHKNWFQHQKKQNKTKSADII